MINILVLIIFLFFHFKTAICGEIKGKIKNEKNEPIQYANIILLNTQFGTTSDRNGLFKLNKITTGKYQLRVSSIGYVTQEIEVNVLKDEIIELEITLINKVIELSTIKVEASRIQDQKDTRTSLNDIEPLTTKILPGAGEDIMRALQTLPGVVAVNDFSSQLIIRGSGPDQNLIIFDEIEVFNPYRLYGAISMFNPETVNDITLITGGFPSRYGDRLSAVLDVTTRDGNKYEFFTGNVNLNITNANLVFEGKYPFNLNGSWLFSSRRTYYDLILGPIARKKGILKGNIAFPNFYDFQFKTSFVPFNNHKMIFSSVFSRDNIDLVTDGKRVSPDSLGVTDNTYNKIIGLNYILGYKNFVNKTILSYYNNKGETNFDGKFLDPTLNRKEFQGEISDSIYQFLYGFSFNSLFNFIKYSFENRTFIPIGSSNFEFGFGADWMETTFNLDIKLDSQFKAIINSNPNLRSALNKIGSKLNYWKIKSYFQGSSLITNKIIFSYGVRYDYYDILSKFYFCPRFSASFLIDDLTTIRASYGIFRQSPGYEKIRDQNILFDFSKKYTRNLNAESAAHYILSFERLISSKLKFKIESYIKDFKDLIVPKKVKGTQFITSLKENSDPKYLESWTEPLAIQSDSITLIPINNSTGKSYGLEIFLSLINKSPQEKLHGWLSYSYSVSNRSESGNTFPFRFDQRNTLNLVVNYKFSEWLELGIRWQYGSGLPYTEPIGIKPRIVIKDTDNDGNPDTLEIVYRQQWNNPNSPKLVQFQVDYGIDPILYNSRKPDYHRLDLRVSFYPKFFDLHWLFYLDIINLYNRKNVVGYDYYIDQNLVLQRRATYSLPIIPTIGISVRF